MSLIEIKEDVFGISKPATTLLNGLGHGIAALSSFATSRWRNGIAIANYEDWHRALEATRVVGSQTSLTLGERADLQLKLDSIRPQMFREAIGFSAVEQHRAALADGEQESGELIDEEWLNKFWALAGQISSTDRQQLWGRILSRKSLDPGSVSVRTLNFLSEITPAEGAMLNEIASCSFVTRNFNDELEAGLIYGFSPETFREEAQKPINNSSVVMGYHPNRALNIFTPAGFWLQSEGWAHSLLVKPGPSTSLKIGSRSFSIRMRNGEFKAQLSGQPHVDLASTYEISAMGLEVIGLINAPPNNQYIDSLSSALSACGNVELVEL